MRKPISVQLFIEELQPNISPVLAGLARLHDEGFVKLDIRFSKTMTTGLCQVVMTINEKVTVFVDTGDDSRIRQKDFANNDYYLKRMVYKKDLITHPQKLLPLGLNYVVDLHSKHLMKAILLSGNWKVIRYRLPQFFSSFATLLGKNQWAAAVPQSNLYGKPNTNSNPKVIFFSRLFHPTKNSPINDERIELIRRMRATFGTSFEGGVSNDTYGKRLAPDLILDDSATQKRHYLNKLNGFNIGISNQGLFGSIGWKQAEYTMKSMAVVCNDISSYHVPGTYSEQQNYLSWKSVDEALTKVELLLSDRSLLSHIQQQNFEYTQKHLHPSQLMKQIIEQLA